MRRLRCFLEGEWNIGDTIDADAEESRHLLKVLRSIPGTEVDVLNGKGRTGDAILMEGSNRSRANLQITNVIQHDRPALNLHIACATIKSSLYEDSFEQAIELGMTEFTPLMTDYTVATWDEKKSLKKIGRLQKLARERLKQCEQPWLPVINHPLSLRELLEKPVSQQSNLIALCERTPDGITKPQSLLSDQYSDILALIGPEGGWSPAELGIFEEYSVRKSTLGPMVLRTETAFTAFCATVLALLKSTG